MRRFLKLLCVLGTVLPLPLYAQSTINDVSWLSGCWQAVGGDAGSEEHWLTPAGGSMLGIARTVHGGKTVAYEYMRIHEEKNALIFTAKPSGKAEASFLLLSLDKQKVVFENLRPEFPQRVIYHLQENGNLLGRIEGRLQDLDKGINFPMHKVSCTGK